MSEVRTKGDPNRYTRHLAKQKLAETTNAKLEGMTPEEIKRLVHELEVHQVEIEIQNQQLEEAHREAELSSERYRLLYDAAPIGYLTLDSHDVILSANVCSAELLHVPHAKLLGRKFADFVAPSHQDRWHFARRALVERGKRQSTELALQLEDGTFREVGLTAAGLPGASAKVNLGMLDMTELRRSERSLRKAATEVALAEQRERRKLAADLHDDAGQLISLASIKLRSLSSSMPGHRESEVAELSDLLDQTRHRITSLSFQMSPPLLHDVGLIAATRWLAEDLARTYGLKVTIVASPELPLDEVTRITLFQAIRELLINVKKHSQTDEATAQIWRESVMVRVAIEDRGIGVDSGLINSLFVHPGQTGGFGLLALRERLAQLGGALEIGTGRDGSGSRVVVSLPIFSSEGDS